MAEHEKDPIYDVISFDLFEDIDTENMEVFTENKSIPEEDKDQIDRVVTLMDSVNSREIIDFQSQENEHRHRLVDEEELDLLAGKNSATATNYQTRWAVTVMRGTLQLVSIKKDQ